MLGELLSRGGCYKTGFFCSCARNDTGNVGAFYHTIYCSSNSDGFASYNNIINLNAQPRYQYCCEPQ